MVVFDGDARLAPCPCPDPPLTIAASGGRFDPPGDVVLHRARLELGGVPVFGLPWLWLRAPDRVGLLPPVLALRGDAGLLVGGGVHLPWRGAERAIDLSAAGYTAGGFQLGAALATPELRARAVLDQVTGTRAQLDARGAVSSGPAALVFSLDALRGDRARALTVDLDEAARPHDTGAVEASLRAVVGAVGFLGGVGITARAERGEGPIAAGPRLALAAGGALGRAGSFHVDADGVVLGDASAAGTLPLGRAEAGAELDLRPGPFELRVGAGARARYGGPEGAGGAPSRETAAAARADLSLPFARTFAGEAPITHWIVPALTLRAAVADVRGDLFQPIAGVVPGASWLAATGVTTAAGRYAGPSARLEARAGVTGDAASARSLLHAHLGADARVVAVSAEAAAVGRPVPGLAALLRSRLGAEDGPFVRLDAALQSGAGAGDARAVASSAWAWLPGDPLAYLATSGFTFGAEVSVPWARVVRTSARADLDLGTGALLAVRGAVLYRHPCGCLGLGLTAGHRLGREGVDAALTLDLVPPARPTPR